MTPSDRVISHERSDVYHKPNATYRRSRCGSISVSTEKLEAGVVEIEPKESAQDKGLRRCERCFRNELDI